MNYHNITKDDMINGDGLRVVLWVSGCTHYCEGCHNPVTWDLAGGLPFDEAAEKELFDALTQEHIAGITFSGGDPLHPFNRSEVARLIKKCREVCPEKSVWVYTGYLWEDIKDEEYIKDIDVLLDGRFVQELNDNTIQWVGSTNQRVIDVAKSLDSGNVVIHTSV